jgi:hypothetical protein
VIWRAVSDFLGLRPGYWQSWWGGFGGDAGSFTLLGMAGVSYKRLKCQECWRLSLRGELGHVAGTHWHTCHRHTTAADHERLAKQHAILHPLMHEKMKGTT